MNKKRRRGNDRVAALSRTLIAAVDGQAADKSNRATSQRRATCKHVDVDLGIKDLLFLLLVSSLFVDSIVNVVATRLTSFICSCNARKLVLVVAELAASV